MRQLEGPLSPTERIYTLDVVRGFALLGILIMNMPGFANSFFVEADGSHLWSAPVDRAAEVVRDMLFSGKFNSMFSLLFGIGFTIQFARMQELSPGHATQLYLRRLLVLLAIRGRARNSVLDRRRPARLCCARLAPPASPASCHRPDDHRDDHPASALSRVFRGCQAAGHDTRNHGTPSGRSTGVRGIQ